MYQFFLAIGVFVILFNVIAAKSYSAEDIQLSENQGIHVLELFTSQSCSSCPAADAFLEELDKNQNIITLSCNVTYWNHLHWKDTLSQEICTERQLTYSLSHNRQGNVFTPELVINGKKSLVGSSRKRIVNYLSDANNMIPSLDIQQSDNTLQIQSVAGQSTLSNTNQVVMIVYGDKHKQYVESGENSGRTINYSNPVTAIKSISQHWDGVSTIEYPLPVNRDTVSGIVVLVTEVESGSEIIAAGRLML
ncbi:MAG: DUF1223 domain-containing protein [Pseudomonadota bacterium]